MKTHGHTIGVTIFVVTLITGCFMLNLVSAASTDVVKISGSTTVLPIISSCRDEFLAENNDTNSNLDVQVSAGGSGAGIAALIAGTVDIAMSSRDIKSSELTQIPNLNKTVIAKDALAIAVNNNNNITQITITQVKSIYNGTYTNWNQVGGADQVIVVMGRESTSGTYEYFNEHIMLKTSMRSDVQQKTSNAQMQTDISSTPGAIGYVGLGFLDGIKGLNLANSSLNYVKPSIENALSLSYPAVRDLYLFTNGVPTGLVKEFIDFVMSPTGQAIVQEEGFVPVGEVGSTGLGLFDSIDSYSPVLVIVSMGLVAGLLVKSRKNKKIPQ